MKLRLAFASLLVLLAYPAFAQSHSAALTWTLSTDDTTTACAVTGAACSQNVYRASGACSSTSVFTSLGSVSATATAYTDSTIVPGNYCYAVTFTIGGQTSVIFQTGDTNFASVSLSPAPESSLAVVVK